MARIRSIKPEIWAHEQLGRLSMGARLTFIGLISLADDEGRGRGDSEYLWGQIHGYQGGLRGGGNKARWRRIIGELEACRDKDGPIVVFYQVCEATYYWLPGFKRQQRIDRPSPSKLPTPPNSTNDLRALDEGSTLEQGARRGEEGIRSREGKEVEQDPPTPGSGPQTPTSPPPGPPSDPRHPLLEQANTRVGLRLLAAAAPDLGHNLKAHYASSIPLRELAAVCLEARTRKNPAGWLRKAVEHRWRREAELAPETAAEVLAELGNGAPEVLLPRAYAPPRPRLEGEADDDYLRRVADLKKAEAKA